MTHFALATALALTQFASPGCDSAAGDDAQPAQTANKSDKRRGDKRDSDKPDKRDNDKPTKSDARDPSNTDAPKPKFKLGRIDHKAISESSGVIASRRHPNVFYTHNDSGNGPYLFAIARDGKFLAEYPLGSVRNNDWEAITTDDAGNLYVGDIGNNDLKRDRLLVYRVPEPDPAAAGPRGKGAALKATALYRLAYPDQKRFDAEALFIHDGHGYVISKLLTGKQAGLYRFDLAAPGGADAAPLEHVCDLPIRSPVSDAAISPDGKQLAVLTVTGPNLFDINNDPASAATATPRSVTYFDPQDLNMEGVCFVEEGLLATTEQGQMLLFRFELFK